MRAASAPLPFQALAKKEHLFRSAPFAPRGSDLRCGTAKKPAPLRFWGSAPPCPLRSGERTFWQSLRSVLSLLTAHFATLHRSSFLARAFHYSAAEAPRKASTTQGYFWELFFGVSGFSFKKDIKEIYIVFYWILGSAWLLLLHPLLVYIKPHCSEVHELSKSSKFGGCGGRTTCQQKNKKSWPLTLRYVRASQQETPLRPCQKARSPSLPGVGSTSPLTLWGAYFLAGATLRFQMSDLSLRYVTGVSSSCFLPANVPTHPASLVGRWTRWTKFLTL